MRVRGQAALLRELRADLAPVFGAAPFTVAVVSPGEVWDTDEWWGDMVLVWIEWPGWRYWHPMPSGYVRDARTRRGLIDRIGWNVWQRQLPAQRRLRKRGAVAVGPA